MLGHATVARGPAEHAPPDPRDGMPAQPLRVRQRRGIGILGVAVQGRVETRERRGIPNAERPRRGVRERTVPGRVQVHAILGPDAARREPGVPGRVEHPGPGRLRARRDESGEPLEPPPHRAETRMGGKERGDHEHVGAAAAERVDRVAEARGERLGPRVDPDQVVAADEHRHQVGVELGRARHLRVDRIRDATAPNREVRVADAVTALREQHREAIGPPRYSPRPCATSRRAPR
ncbi:hypothetical protein GCM10025870_05520 [Agromyces marinus]|uniref:Uncharacterized protein n=1 Tax=Agromyces marinus TaxID=1389020 RepID=A0ABM8GYB1_9MICO|nr:hypothetical protein GCM10025870_05520 [Agromyces marinus]